MTINKDMDNTTSEKQEPRIDQTDCFASARIKIIEIDENQKQETLLEKRG